ncbi:MAG: FAD-dependent oxidoreductase, partial [Variovorax sp.]
MDEFDCAVIGAGVVGLAVARALALRGREVIVLESEGAIGTGTSSRNSEVIHAGIYYPPGSLRATLCVRGKNLLYAFCAANNVPHARCGKLLVATQESKLPKLAAIRQTAEKNGVHDLEPLGGNAAKALEPELACVAALLSPSTGIIDSHAYMLALEGNIEAHGGSVVLRCPVERIERMPDGLFRLTTGGDNPGAITCRNLVLSAGLHASKLAGTLQFGESYQPPETYYAKGQYYALSGR